jgi:Astacin (Peptidase family M12A)
MKSAYRLCSRLKPARILAFLLLAAVWPHAVLGSNFYQGVATNNLPWPGGIIPYKFDTNVSTNEQAIYLAGMKEWELAGNIHFVPYTNQANYVLLRFDYMQGTNTYVATIPPVMTIDTLSRAQICHETGHLLGFQHEHVRTNRNSFITVNFTNLIGNGTDAGTNGSGEGGSVSNLYVIDTNSTAFGAYDFESVMHYSRTLFSTNPDTADTIDPNAPYYAEYYYRIGNYAMSPGDRAGAAYLYGPPATALTNIVTNTADVGLGSLRAALYYANDHPGSTIHFNIPTNDPGYSNGVYTIYLTGELPPLIANGTVIDATTQPGYTNHPVVALSGSRLSPETAYSNNLFTCGLRVYAANCTVDGLSIHDFPFLGIAVEYAFAVSNRIESCYIGLAPNSTNAAGNAYQGISIDTGASFNVVGGTSTNQRNVISGNAQYGVYIAGTNGQFGATQIGTNTVGNVIQGSYIGTDGTGSHAVSNLVGGIIVWQGATAVTVGGTNAGAGNVLSGNKSAGLFLIDVSNNIVQGNYIGLNAAGTAAVPNSDSGIQVVAGSASNVIGGTVAGARNVISGNVNYGIFVSDPGTENLVVQGNYIGTDPHGTNALGNGYSGIGIWSSASNVLVGGTNAGAPNLISGNDNGISLGGSGVVGVQIFGNYVGVASNGVTALPNTGDGIYLEQGVQNNTVGGTLAGERNLISGNGGNGVHFYGSGTSYNTVQGNYIGLASNGVTAVPNLGSGIYLEFGPQSNAIGGTLAGQENLISANVGDGIQFYGSGTSDNMVQGNYIGTTKTGLSPLGNGGVAVSFRFGANSNTLGGTTTTARNLLCASTNQGIFIDSASNEVVQGNYIGVGADGATPLGNGVAGPFTQAGIYVLAGESNLIGGAAAGAGNVISANGNDGVQFYGQGISYNVVQGNYIGTTATGLGSLGNGASGLSFLYGPQSNTVGGFAAGNVISGNSGVGLFLAGASNIIVQGNNIGVGSDGVTALGNGQQGILLQSGATTNVIGLDLNGAGTGNIIADNTYEGIIMYDTNTLGNTVRGGSIYSNGVAYGLLGINLVGVPGPNNLQNYPVITNASVVLGSTTISGTLSSTPNRGFLIDVYRNTTPDVSGYGQGQVYVGGTTLTTGGGGTGSFTLTSAGGFAGQYFTAIATDATTGNSSEFGLDVAASNGPVPLAFLGPYAWNHSTGFSFTMALQSNQNYTVQTTTNLAAKPIIWTTLSNFTSTNITVQFIDHSATNPAVHARFYRIVSP